MPKGARAAVLIVAAWFAPQVLASSLTGFRSERAIASVVPVGAVCGAAFLTSTQSHGRRRGVGLMGSYVVEPRGGIIEVAVSHGAVVTRLSVVRGERVVREAEVVVRAGERTRLRAGALRIHEHTSSREGISERPCVDLLKANDAL